MFLLKKIQLIMAFIRLNKIKINKIKINTTELKWKGKMENMY